MALHLQYQSTSGGSFTSISLSGIRVGGIRVSFSDSAPARMTLHVVQSQQSLVLALGWFIRFWDDAGTTPDAVAQSSSNPLFEGFIVEAQPAASNRVDYVAYDPSQKAGKEITVMSTAWDASGGAGVAPLPGTGAVPRLILNNNIDNDVDYAFERASNQAVSDIVKLILDDAYEPLRWYNAAPSAAVPYTAADLTGLSFIPQEKIVFTNETIRSAIDRVTQQNYPEYGFYFEPGARKWRWYSKFAATPVTLTLNDPDNANNVLSLEIHRSLEDRYPAVEFYGPEQTETRIFSTIDATLNITDAGTVLEEYTDTGGAASVIAHRVFQIADADSRRGAKRFPATFTVRDSDYHWVGTQSPMLECSFDYGNQWMAVESVWFDFQNGIAMVPEGLYIYFWSDQHLVSGSTQNFWVPNAYRLIWAPYVDPITVRRPASGFSGTSYTVAGMVNSKRIYDEMLSVGYSRAGTPVTTASRITQFQELGDAMLAAHKDIAYAGGCVLEGLLYDWCRLNRCVNLAAVNHNGVAVATGWEGIKAVVSDVEYDFANQTTTLTFSQQHLQGLGDNIDLLKTRLRMGAVQRVQQVSFQTLFREVQTSFDWHPGKIQQMSGVIWNMQDLYYDPNLGTLEKPL